MQVFDGFETLEEGMNGGLHPSLVPGNQAYKSINVTFRGGKPRTRPRFQEITIVADSSTLALIRDRKFQGMLPYRDKNSVEYIAFAIGGNIFLLNAITNVITHLTTGGGATALDESVDRIYMVQADKWLICQDGGVAGTIVIADATASHDAATGVGAAEEGMPFGTIMEYCHGRLFIKTGPRTFEAGDIVKANAADSVKKFTENQYLAGGGSFLTPAANGEITAMFAAHRYSTGTGQGPLVVLGQHGGQSYNVSLPRYQIAGEGVPGWANASLANIEPPGHGCTAHYSVTAMNEDIFHMSWRGMQSEALVKHETATLFRVTNLIEELKPFWKQEDPTKLPFAFSTSFDDRLLFTIVADTCTAKTAVGATIDDHCFKGIAVIDFATFNGVATLGKNVRPVFDGVWTGIRPMGLESSVFANKERCYCWAKDANNQNRLFEILDELGDDNTVTNGDSPIECSIQTGAVPFISFLGPVPAKVPHLHKTLLEAAIWLSELRADINLTMMVKPEFANNFALISTIRKDIPATSAVQSASQVPFPAFDKVTCDPVSGRIMLRGYRYQFKLAWSGVMQIDKFTISAIADKEPDVMPCGETGIVAEASTEDDFTYSL